MLGLTKRNLPVISSVLNGSAYDFSLLECLHDPKVVVDIGANIGSFVIAIKAVLPKVYVLAVEPDPECFGFLKSNTSAYENVSLVNVALSDHTGTCEFFLGDDDHVQNSTTSSAMNKSSLCMTVQSDTLANIFKKKTSASDIDVLKIDAEGAEWYLLNGDLDFKNISIIYLEYHSANFIKAFLEKILPSHVIYSANIRFPHRGEISLLRKDLVPHEQAKYEIVT